MPRTSVLGPILFLLYISDLPGSLQSQVHQFANDTAVYLTVHGQEDAAKFQNDLDNTSRIGEGMEYEIQSVQVPGLASP